LSNKGYNVIGILLETDLLNETISHLPSTNLKILTSSVCDHEYLKRIIQSELPEIILNFAGISFIPYSWDAPLEVEKINGYAVGGILQIIREVSPNSRFFQACSSEIFGHHPVQSPQDEQTPFNPDNPYGSSKIFAYHLTMNYRERFGLFACAGILYNHESEWRPRTFVSRKITMAAAAIKLGMQRTLELGGLDTVRDWSYAGDIVNAIWLMTTTREPKNYVLASGSLHSVRDILDIAFDYVGLDWHKRVVIDKSLERDSEGKPLCGDSSLARQDLGWEPKVSFEDTIVMMVEKDLERFKAGSQIFK
jgi:GDPmannose 4,6-dehydratase